MKLYLIRHAITTAPTGVCYGRSDYPAQADANQSAAQQLAASLPPQIPLYCSPRQRCTALAHALCALRPDLPPAHMEPRLRELDFGCWEGVAWNAIPRGAFDAWMADFSQHAFGGAESNHAMLLRIQDFLQALKRSSAENVACICHAGTIRAIQFLLQHHGQADALQNASQWPTTAIDFGHCLQLELS